MHTVSWEHAYDACPPEAADLLRAVSVLDVPALASPAVGAAAGLTAEQAAAGLAGLAETGWTDGERHTLPAPARAWLTGHAAGLVAPRRAAEIVREFAEYHAAAVDPDRRTAVEVRAWLAGHRAEIVAAVAACDRDGLRPHGIRLASTVWPEAGLVNDPAWWDALAEAGEAVAVAAHDPAGLAELLHRSATVFAAKGDRLRAEAQWVRALAVARRRLREHPDDAEDRDRAAAILAALRGLYHDWGRPAKALDAEQELVELHRSAGDELAAAEALSRVAATLYAVGRTDGAADYFALADEAMAAAGGAPGQHARILLWTGRALWELGRHGHARRQWHRALAMTVDVDDAVADHARALLATAPDAPLPEGYPIPAGSPNTSSSESGGPG
ncbi:MAG TPA: hypothetical protein VFV67_13250 [Actinophytocola sp.]|uniref:hypothetical protein n=1 Tax=Actinophytocola sp. TaxID=1872138 RepID=UPI002DBC4BDB|nr:hypothetical protein [Actinophytocola sp.]HEU5471614.1 hypothetical protein [Actinophytocola sp.]